MKIMHSLVLCSVLAIPGHLCAKEKKEKVTIVASTVAAEEKKDQFAVIAPTASMATEDQGSNETEGQQTKRILTTFLDMLGHFATLLSDPKNPNVVGSQIAQILSGMLTIAMEAFNKSKMTEDKHDLEPRVELDDAFINELKSQFIAYADKLKLAHDC